MENNKVFAVYTIFNEYYFATEEELLDIDLMINKKFALLQGGNSYQSNLNCIKNLELYNKNLLYILSLGVMSALVFGDFFGIDIPGEILDEYIFELSSVTCRVTLPIMILIANKIKSLENDNDALMIDLEKTIESVKLFKAGIMMEELDLILNSQNSDEVTRIRK